MTIAEAVRIYTALADAGVIPVEARYAEAIIELVRQRDDARRERDALNLRVAVLRDGIRVAAYLLDSVAEEQAPNMALSYLALALMHNDVDGVLRTTSRNLGVDTLPEWPLGIDDPTADDFASIAADARMDADRDNRATGDRWPDGGDE